VGIGPTLKHLGSSLGGAAHVLDYVGPCEIDFDRLPSKGQ